MSTTTNLEKFGWRELRMASELLNAMIEKGLPDDFYNEEVTIMFNQNSGSVFLTNREYEVAMLNDKKELESWYFLGYHGYEGFLDDLMEMFHNDEIKWQDWEELAYICERNNREDDAEAIRKMLRETIEEE